MDISEITVIGRDLVYTAMLLSLPVVATSLLVGLLVSFFQTLTSIQEQTMSFAPRIFAVGVVFLVTLPWMLQTAMRFAIIMLQRAAEVQLD